MKILLDPALAILANDLSTEEKAELLMCILEYPNRDCDLGLWRYIKKQIDEDAQKYKEKCERIAINRMARRGLKSDMKSTMESDLFSTVNKDVVNKIQIKDNCNVDVVDNNASGIVENAVENFFISDNFTFQDISDKKPAFATYLTCYRPPVVERAEKTIKQKRFGQYLSMKQILDWLEQENTYFQQKHKGTI